MSFYNTINLSLGDLIQAELTAKKQEKFILTIFDLLEDKWLTPFHIQDIGIQNGKNMEITSVRRAITNLEKQGKLIKSAKASFMGKLGSPNHAWKFNNGKLL